MAGLVDEPRPGRRKPELVLVEAERAELTRWARRAKTAQFLALRAKIVLRCAEGGTKHRRRQRHIGTAPPPPGHRVQKVPDHDRQGRSRRPRRPRGL
jgi:hypothetical protein